MRTGSRVSQVDSAQSTSPRLSNTAEIVTGLFSAFPGHISAIKPANASNAAEACHMCTRVPVLP